MPRRLLGVFILLLASSSFVWAQGDVVLLTVGGDSVSRSEFEYYLAKSQEKRGHVLAQTLGRFKQKVQWAKELGLDTLPDYVRQKEACRWRLMANKETSSKQESALSAKEWVKLKHITYPLNQYSGKTQEREGWKQLDSLHAELKQGADVPFESMPWTQTRHLLGEWQEQLGSLEKGEYSRPFLSPLGMHIILWTDKRTEKSQGGIQSSDDYDFRVKELEEGLLLVHLDACLDERFPVTEPELDTYFAKYREKYGWGTPHYQGAVIHCQDKKEAKRIKKFLAKYPEALWKEALERMPDDVSKGCLMEVGLFAIGSNPYVDKLAFKCGTYEPLADYPYTWLLGKRLKKGPVSYKDVRKEVEKDCREEKKKTEMEAFMQKFPIEFNEEVLKTVNHFRNK